MVSIHFVASTPNFLILEFRAPVDDARRDVLDEPPMVNDGYAKIPNKPGSDVQLNRNRWRMLHHIISSNQSFQMVGEQRAAQETARESLHKQACKGKSPLGDPGRTLCALSGLSSSLCRCNAAVIQFPVPKRLRTDNALHRVAEHVRIVETVESPLHFLEIVIQDCERSPFLNSRVGCLRALSPSYPHRPPCFESAPTPARVPGDNSVQ